MKSETGETSVGAESSDDSTTFAGRGLREWGFYLTILITLGLAAVMMRAELVLAFTGWVTDLGIHQVHDLTVFAMLWIALVIPMALLLYRPIGRVNAVLAPIVFLAPIAVFAFLANSPILMLPLIFGALSLVVLALHPDGRSIFRFDRVEHVNRALAALVVVAAIPLLVYAGGQLLQQFTVADDHTLLAHYGVMAIGAVYVVLMGTLATLRQRDWRFAAWSAGALAAVIGASSITFAVASSVGPIWGSLAILWAIAFVAATEYVRSRATVADDASSPLEPEAPRPA